MKFKKLILVLFLVTLLGAVFYFKSNILDWYSRLTQKISQAEKIPVDSLINEIEKQISTPPPLRSTQQAEESLLTKAGVIKWTNSQRQKNGMAPLVENAKLNAVALAKAQDMFKNQYFAHVSPSGSGAAELAKNAGYQFISLGENLAMGNFANDQTLVQGWMDSPGHRANILSPRFRDIGVAVAKGSFQGQTTWLAVQEFGLPTSACPQPSLAFKNQIEVDKNQATSLSQTIEARRIEIDNTQFASPAQFNQMVSQYNSLVEQYNGLVGQIKVLVNQYNAQVSEFNQCANQKNNEPG